MALSRRRVLRGLYAGTFAAVAGCTDSGSDPAGTVDDADTPAGTSPPSTQRRTSSPAADWSGQLHSAQLRPPEWYFGDTFGSSVAMSADGTTAVVGVTNDERNSEGSDAVYVFARTGESWTRQARLVAEDDTEGNEDGFAVDVGISAQGNTVVVGASEDEDPNGPSAGSAFVFTRTDGSWSQHAKLPADDGDSSDRFGHSVALSGDGTTALIGAFGDEDPHSAFAGSAYVFTSSSGEWTQEAKIAAEDGGEYDSFGWSAALSADGQTALVGAHLDSEPNGSESGSAYVFTWASGAWSQQAKLVADDGDRQDWFGRSVAISDDGTTAVVGAHADEDPNGDSAGSAYVFDRGNGSWTQQSKFAPDDIGTDDAFGRSVGISGDGTQVLVGASGGSSAHVFARVDDSWARQTVLRPPRDGTAGSFGDSVDVAASGSPAIVVDDDADTESGVGQGWAYVFEA